MGDLRLVARIAVAVVTNDPTEAAALANGGDLWEDASEFAFGSGEGSRTKQDIDLSEIARDLEFAGAVPRLPEAFSGKNLQAIRRLTSASAELLEAAWETEGTAPAGVTKNPPWQRDEVILAWDLYRRLGGKIPNTDHPEVIALSDLLNRLPIHTVRTEKFRNPNGVKFKLANLRAVEQPGSGARGINRLDQVVWEEFGSDEARLRATAAAIVAGVGAPEAQSDVGASEEPDEEEFPEGRIIYRLHRARERSRALVERKKARVLRSKGKLACEACKFDFAAVYGSFDGLPQARPFHCRL